jgi:hypothetical protein
MTMKPITIESYRADPGLVAALHRRARKARAEAMGNAFLRLIRTLTPRLSVRRLGEHWG